MKFLKEFLPAVAKILVIKENSNTGVDVIYSLCRAVGTLTPGSQSTSWYNYRHLKNLIILVSFSFYSTQLRVMFTSIYHSACMAHDCGSIQITEWTSLIIQVIDERHFPEKSMTPQWLRRSTLGSALWVLSKRSHGWLDSWKSYQQCQKLITSIIYIDWWKREMYILNSVTGWIGNLFYLRQKPAQTLRKSEHLPHLTRSESDNFFV